MTAPDVQTANPSFDGASFDPEHDGDRLRYQLERVKACLIDGECWSLERLSNVTGIKSTASLSARIRDLRKLKFGGWIIRSRRVTGGLYLYQYLGVLDGICDVSVSPETEHVRTSEK